MYYKLIHLYGIIYLFFGARRRFFTTFSMNKVLRTNYCLFCNKCKWLVDIFKKLHDICSERNFNLYFTFRIFSLKCTKNMPNISKGIYRIFLKINLFFQKLIFDYYLLFFRISEGDPRIKMEWPHNTRTSFGCPKDVLGYLVFILVEKIRRFTLLKG